MEQLIHGLDDDSMISEILKEASVLGDINYVTSNNVWTQRVEVLGVQKVALDSIREANDFDPI